MMRAGSRKRPECGMKLKNISPLALGLTLAMLGAGTLFLVFLYYVYAVGFPIPVPHASRYTDEEMSRINPPNLTSDIIFYFGQAMCCAGLALIAFRLIRSVALGALTRPRSQS